MHEKERFVQRGGVFGLDDVVGDFDASGVESLREIADMIRTQAREGVRSAMALAGSAAQSKFQLFPGRLRLLRARAHRRADARGRRRGAGRDDDRERRAHLHQPAPAVRGDEARPVPLGVQPRARSRSRRARRSAGAWRRSTCGSCAWSTRPARPSGCACTRSRWTGFRQAGLGVRRPRARPRGAGVEGDRRDLGGTRRVGGGPRRRARQLLPGGLPRPREPGRRRAAGAARLARRAGELPRADHGRDRQVLRRGARELRQGRQAALQHHPHPAARRRRVVPAAALRRPAGPALPGRRDHARPERGDPRRPARPRDDRRAARRARGHHRRLLHRRGPRGDHRPGAPAARDGRGRAARGRRPHRRRLQHPGQRLLPAEDLRVARAEDGLRAGPQGSVGPQK